MPKDQPPRPKQYPPTEPVNKYEHPIERVTLEHLLQDPNLLITITIVHLNGIAKWLQKKEDASKSLDEIKQEFINEIIKIVKAIKKENPSTEDKSNFKRIGTKTLKLIEELQRLKPTEIIEGVAHSTNGLTEPTVHPDHSLIGEAEASFEKPQIAIDEFLTMARAVKLVPAKNYDNSPFMELIHVIQNNLIPHPLMKFMIHAIQNDLIPNEVLYNDYPSVIDLQEALLEYISGFNNSFVKSLLIYTTARSIMYVYINQANLVEKLETPEHIQAFNFIFASMPSDLMPAQAFMEFFKKSAEIVILQEEVRD